MVDILKKVLVMAGAAAVAAAIYNYLNKPGGSPADPGESPADVGAASSQTFDRSGNTIVAGVGSLSPLPTPAVDTSRSVLERR
jgi:hypothetical protein